jgi:hypothetical protein
LAGIEGGATARDNIKKEKPDKDESGSSGSDDDDSGSDSGSGKDSRSSGTESESGRGRRREKGEGRRAKRRLEGKMRSDAIKARQEVGGSAAVERGEATPPRDRERWEHDKFADMDRSKADRDAASFGAHWSKIKSEKVSTGIAFCKSLMIRVPVFA